MDKEKLKVLFASDLVVETGFSTVAHNIIKYNKDRFDFTGLGVNYSGDPHSYDFPIYPAMVRGMGNIYGLDRMCSLMNQIDFDLVFILNDSWVISYYLDAIKKNVTKKLPPIVVYFPVDSKWHDSEWYRDFDIVSEAYTYTEFGKSVVTQPSCMPEMILGVMPHGVDLEDFYQISEDRKQSKVELFGSKLKGLKHVEETFIVLNANRNQPRKKLDITMQGFAQFAEDKPDNVKLYMHCGIRDAHIDVVKEAKRWKMDNRLIFTSLANGIQRVSKERLNLIYNACDVGINTSMGEGWGLTNVEHAVTGAAQLVPRHSSCQEMFIDSGLLLETFYDWTFDNSQTVGRVTTPEEVARCLEIYYKDRDILKYFSEKGKDKFSRPDYQWKTIAQRWGDIFEEVCT